LKPRGEISTEVMAAFIELFNGRIDGKKEDKKSTMKISFNPFFVVAFLFKLFLINYIELGYSLVSYLCISLLFSRQSLSCHLTSSMLS
jgi:hypothetical protein